MMASAAHSLGLFALVWATLCVLASALVTDTLLRDIRAAAPDR